MLFRILISVGLAATVAVATGCEGTGEISSTISGNVFDSIVKVPIESAWVNTFESTAEARFTDSSGSFTLVSFGRPNRIFAGKAGYKTKSQFIPGTGHVVRGVRIELEPDSL